MDENRISDLALMYQLFSRVKRGLEELCSYFGAYIKVRVHLSLSNQDCLGCQSRRYFILIIVSI